MSGRWLVLVTLGAGCGRLGFDATGEESACHVAASAPDPISVGGSTIRFVDFMGTSAPVDGVTITARSNLGSVTTTSDAQGAFVLTLPTAGIPISPTLALDRVSDMTSMYYLGTQLDASQDLTLEITNTSSMFAVYAQVQLVRAQARGTLLVFTRDCSNAFVSGVTIDVVPPPALVGYYAADGTPTAPSTSSMFARAIGYNAVAGPTRIRASKAGVSFLEANVDVLAGDVQTIVIMRPVE